MKKKSHSGHSFPFLEFIQLFINSKCHCLEASFRIWWIWFMSLDASRFPPLWWGKNACLARLSRTVFTNHSVIETTVFHILLLIVHQFLILLWSTMVPYVSALRKRYHGRNPWRGSQVAGWLAFCLRLCYVLFCYTNEFLSMVLVWKLHFWKYCLILTLIILFQAFGNA